MDPLFWNGLSLGLVFCATPGALNAEALRRGLVRGFASAFLVEVGSLIGDGAWAVLGLSGAAYITRYRPAALVLASLGSVFLLWLAFSAFSAAWRRTTPSPQPERQGGDFATGALISLTNPYTVAFWIGLGGAVTVLDTNRSSVAQYTVFLGAFMLGAVLWCLLVSVLIGWGRRVVRPSFFRVVNVICGTVLAYAGVKLLVRILV